MRLSEGDLDLRLRRDGERYRSFFTRSTGGSGWNTYNGQWMVAFADGHAKSRKIGVFTTGKTDPRVDPFASYGGTDGKVTSTMTR